MLRSPSVIFGTILCIELLLSRATFGKLNEIQSFLYVVSTYLRTWRRLVQLTRVCFADRRVTRQARTRFRAC